MLIFIELRMAPLAKQQSLTNLPQELSLDSVLEAMAQGKEVVFVDTREHVEFSEVRLPQAVHLPLRDIDKSRLLVCWLK